MKNTILLLFLIPVLSFSQNFEGTLVYENDIIIAKKFSKQFGMTKEKMMRSGKFFEETLITYKNGNYLSKPTKEKIKVVYLSERNEILTIDKKSDLVPAIIAEIDVETELKDKKPKITVEQTDEVILDIKCSKVIVEWETGTYEYFFNSDYLKMDSTLYSNHKYDMWSEYLKLSNSLPLKIIKRIDGMMTITMTLKETKEHSVNDKIFKLPKLELSKEFVVSKGNQVYYKRK
ncbi:hypothetical protein [uncultured Maribacter sp.]|uniref:hypothetical protein n=1 Tax=uncultured Maribacter sp. TaxID=431308 RepID=UPI002639BB08|nr:hypothetical protein [uncultured Maribacter sp.]